MLSEHYYAILAVLGILVGFTRYVLYFRDIARGTAKPHVFTWFVWGLLTAIIFFIQLLEGGGAGAWITGVVSLASFAISSVALFKGEKEITRFDRVCFVSALLAIVVWRMTENPLLAVVIVTGIDALAYAPTFRKSYHKPFEEPVNGYAIATLRSLFGILALQSLTLTTVLYPAATLLMDGSFTILLWIRQRQLRKSS